MPFEFKLPDVGEGLHEGEIVQWYVKEGQTVEGDQHLVDVLTDKATVEITCPHPGKVLKLKAKPGDKVMVGQTIVVFGQEGEVYNEGSNGLKEAHHQAPAPSVVFAAGAAVSAPAGEVLATPAVRKLAKELHVNLAGISGTGSAGRITEDDVRRAAAKVPPAALVSFGQEERVPFLGIRRKTAEKMSQSSHTVAHVTHADEADMTDLVALREKTKAEAQSQGVKLTFLAYIVKALAATLKEFPYLNASLDEPKQEIVLKRYCNIGVAVDTEKGLFTPVVKDCHQKTIFQIAKELDELANKAKAGQIEASNLQGGTFTVTNIGPIGGLWATPIVNYPEVAILGVMKIVKRPVVKNGQVVVRDMMNLCLSFDHRVLDGAEAARFTSALIKRLESPTSI